MADTRYLNAARVAQIVALALAVVAVLAVAVLPLSIEETTTSSGGHSVRTLTLLQTSSALSTMIPATIPVLLTAAPLFVRGPGWRRVSAATTVLLGIFVVLAGFSIGMFYLPALAAAMVSVFLPAPPLRT